jgi:hypothetical protein
MSHPLTHADISSNGVGLQHRLEPLTRVADLVAQLGELLEVPADLAFVPGEQHRFDVWKYL